MKIQKNISKIVQNSFLALAGASFFVSCKNDGYNGVEKEAQPKLIISILSQIEVKKGTEKVGYFAIVNNGNKSAKNIVLTGLDEEPLTIVNNGNKCANIVLVPNKSCLVEFVFKPKGLISGGRTIGISYDNNETNREFKDDRITEIKYLGRGEANIQISPIEQLKANFGNSVSKTLKITNQGDDSAKIIEIFNPSSSFLSLTNDECTNKVIAPNDSCKLDVKYSPIKAAGNFSSDEMESKTDKIRISYKDGVSEEILTKETEFSFAPIGEADISFKMDLDTMITNVKKPLKRMVTITNNGTADATDIKPPEIVDQIGNNLVIENDNNTCLTSLKPQNNCSFIVKLNSDSTASSDIAKVKIKYKDGKTILNSISDPIRYKIVAKNVLNLSKYNVKSTSLEIDTFCDDKEIYGNNLHNIPLNPKFNALDKDGNEIKSISEYDILESTQIQVRAFGNDIPVFHNNLNNEVPFPDSDYFTTPKTQYSKCIGSSSRDDLPLNVKYFKTKIPSGQKIDLGAKIQYIDKSENITTISTQEFSSRKTITVLSNPFGSELTDLFTIELKSMEKSGFSIFTPVENYFKLFKISPNIKGYPSLENTSISKFILKSETMDIFRESNNLENNVDHEIKINGIGGRYNDSNIRKLYAGSFIIGNLKPSNIKKVELSRTPSDKRWLSLDSIGKNDYALGTVSYVDSRWYEGNAGSKFSLILYGIESFGNSFQGKVSYNGW
jgi:hypothetical protein